MSNNKDFFNQNDFVYLKNGDTIESSGYKINSLLMSSEMSPMTTINQIVNKNQSGGSVSSILNDLAVPTGLLLLQQKTLKHYNDNDNQVINDDLFDKLFKLSQPIKNKKLTKRNKLKKHGRKTKRVK